MFLQQCQINPQNFDLHKAGDFTVGVWDCQGEVAEDRVNLTGFRRWQKQDVIYRLPAKARERSYFRASTSSDFLNAKYFARTSFGLFAKVSSGRVMIFANDFNSGKPVDGKAEVWQLKTK